MENTEKTEEKNIKKRRGMTIPNMLTLFRIILIPLMIISFPSMLYGWPTLGSIGKVRETSFTTLLAAMCQIIGLVVLIVIDQFNLLNLALLRFISELVLFGSRALITYKNKRLFKAGIDVVVDERS